MNDTKAKRIEIVRICGINRYQIIVYYGRGIVEFPFIGTATECHAWLATG